MYDIDYFHSAGQTTLKEIQMSETMRVKERTMDQLKSILGRISFTLGNLKEDEEQRTVISLTPESQEAKLLEAKQLRRERIRRKIMKRRKKQKEQQQSKIQKSGKGIVSRDETKKQKLGSNTDIDTESQEFEIDAVGKETTRDKGGQDRADDESVREGSGEMQDTKDQQVDSDRRDNQDSDEDWSSVSSGELDQYDSSDFSDISTDEEDEVVLAQPQSSIAALVNLDNTNNLL